MIWVGIAHPGFSLFGNCLGEDCPWHPGFCAKTVPYYEFYDNETILVLHICDLSGNDAVLPTQKLIPGWANSKKGGGGKVKKIGTTAPIPFLPTLFKKRAFAHATNLGVFTKNHVTRLHSSA